MSNQRVQAVTGMIFVRNRTENVLTRLVDINVVTSCLMFRMIRSWLGVVTPTSGALALDRAHVIFDNLDDYVSSGTAGDDRRLSFYALLEGEVVGVTEAVVETDLPTTVGGTFRQRMRWSKSAWLGVPFVRRTCALWCGSSTSTLSPSCCCGRWWWCCSPPSTCSTGPRGCSTGSSTGRSWPRR